MDCKTMLWTMLILVLLAKTGFQYEIDYKSDSGLTKMWMMDSDNLHHHYTWNLLPSGYFSH